MPVFVCLRFGFLLTAHFARRFPFGDRNDFTIYEVNCLKWNLEAAIAGLSIDSKMTKSHYNKGIFGDRAKLHELTPNKPPAA